VRKAFAATLAAFALVAGAQVKEAAPAKAATAGGKLPSVDSILEQHVKAMGDKSAHARINSRITTGTMEMMGIKAQMTSYSKAPNKQLVQMDIPGFGTVQEGYDGAVAWAKDPATGLREKKGGELAATRLYAELHRSLKLKELYPKIEVVGSDKVGARDVWVLQATPAETSPEKWYFDKENGLLLKLVMERETPQGKLTIETELDGYKEVDGIKMPFVVRQKAGPVAISASIEKVEHNVEIDDAKFQKPSQ
jgi:outer membrane lipoprotein-sorting protein